MRGDEVPADFYKGRTEAEMKTTEKANEAFWISEANAEEREIKIKKEFQEQIDALKKRIEVLEAKM